MDKSAFIKIGETRIKLSNIKNYGISQKHTADHHPIGEYRRKVWFSDHAIRRTFSPYWPKWEDMSFSTDVSHFGRDGRFYEFMSIDDSQMWKNFIDMDALNNEYKKVKALAVQSGIEEKKRNKKIGVKGFFKNAFGKFGVIDEVLSKHEVIVQFYEYDENFTDDYDFSNDAQIELENAMLFRRVVFTSGKLYFNGNTLRCSGSPYKGAKIVEGSKKICSHSRVLAQIDDLLTSGELSKVDYNIKPEGATTRYLYITTYQNDNFTFMENEHNIDEISKYLDDRLASDMP